MKNNRPQSRKQNLVEQEVDGELLIYDLERDRAFCLNRTSALVWQACDGNRTITEINSLIGQQLKTQTDEDIVWLALDQLSKEKLINPEIELSGKYEGMTRRQIVKKIGLGSMVALPVVLSLLAPVAAQANSACMAAAGGCFCNTASPAGTDCTGMTVIACMDTNCRCVSTGTTPFTADNCVP